MEFDTNCISLCRRPAQENAASDKSRNLTQLSVKNKRFLKKRMAGRLHFKVAAV